jgi:hypothetical protein
MGGLSVERVLGGRPPGIIGYENEWACSRVPKPDLTGAAFWRFRVQCRTGGSGSGAWLFGGEGSGMSWSIVGFLASLIPWAIVLLTATDVVCLPCWGMTTASLKGLWGVAVTVAIFASMTGLCRRVAIGWAIAGLALGVVIAIPFALSEPAMAAALAIPTAAVVFALAQWR